jgi:hypothetical protein
MHRTMIVLTIFAVSFMAVPAFAGSPHFVGTCTVTQNSDNTVTVVGKEAGLGSEAQINSKLTVIAACINPGGKNPKAANKTANVSSTTTPVQNGKADINFTSTTPLQTQPSCDPPMTLTIVSATLTDSTNNISQSCTVQ